MKFNYDSDDSVAVHPDDVPEFFETKGRMWAARLAPQISRAMARAPSVQLEQRQNEFSQRVMHRTADELISPGEGGRPLSVRELSTLVRAIVAEEIVRLLTL